MAKTIVYILNTWDEMMYLNRLTNLLNREVAALNSKKMMGTFKSMLGKGHLGEVRGTNLGIRLHRRRLLYSYFSLVGCKMRSSKKTTTTALDDWNTVDE